MPKRPSHALIPAALLALVSLAGCVEFNADCSPPIENPGEVISHLSESVPVDRSVVRTRESALGNAMADAYLFALAEFTPRPLVALETAGAIRDIGLCTTRQQLSGGPLTNTVLRDVVPSSDELVVVELTQRELFDVLEHGVAELDAAAPGGQLLQVSGLSYEVDCSQPAEKLGRDPVSRESRIPGKRVRAVTIGNTRIVRDQASAQDTVAVVVNEFIASGGDKFVDFAGKTLKRTGLFSYPVLEDHLRQLGPSAESPARLLVDSQKRRITLDHCE